METIPTDIKFSELWKHLSYESIVDLCQSSNEFNALICQSNIIWEQLLYRDFGVIYIKDNARNMYLLYRHALNHFSQFYPIITQRALQILVNVAPIETWSGWERSIEDRRQQSDRPDLILTVDVLATLCSEWEFDESGEMQYFVPDVDCEQIEEMSDIRLMYPNFDQMVEELKESDCKEFKTFISNPTLIFINTHPILINYDYELALEFNYNMSGPSHRSCNEQVDQIKNDILALI